MLREKRELFVKGVTRFAQSSPWVLERGRGRRRREELRERGEIFDSLTLRKWRVGRSCAVGKVSWTAIEVPLYSVSQKSSVKTVV